MDDLRDRYIRIKSEGKLTKEEMSKLFGVDAYLQLEANEELQKEVAETKLAKVDADTALKRRKVELSVEALVVKEKALALLSEAFNKLEETPGKYTAQLAAMTRMIELFSKYELSYQAQAGKNQADKEMGVESSVIEFKLASPDPGDVPIVKAVTGEET